MPESTQSAPAELPAEDFKGLCLTCRHWEGDKEAQHTEIARELVCMDRKRGWATSGGCDNYWVWGIALEAEDLSILRLTTIANFGCVGWEEEKPKGESDG